MRKLKYQINFNNINLLASIDIQMTTTIIIFDVLNKGKIFKTGTNHRIQLL